MDVDKKRCINFAVYQIISLDVGTATVIPFSHECTFEGLVNREGEAIGFGIATSVYD